MKGPSSRVGRNAGVANGGSSSPEASDVIVAYVSTATVSSSPVAFPHAARRRFWQYLELRWRGIVVGMLRQVRFSWYLAVGR